MSMQHCDECDMTIDTDFNAEHWDENGRCEFMKEFEKDEDIKKAEDLGLVNTGERDEGRPVYIGTDKQFNSLEYLKTKP